MCYYTEIKFTKKQVLDMYNISTDSASDAIEWPATETTINGFAHPNMPVLLDEKPDLLVLNYSWGLLPEGENESFRKKTLNARVETIDNRRSFMNYTTQRCCVLISNYVDWHWNDVKGKSKTKYHIFGQQEIAALAGIHASWTDPVTGKLWHTFAICTTTPNSTMKYVHNRRADEGEERMPIMLNSGDEKAWLDGRNHHLDFAFPNYQPKMLALTEDDLKPTLF